MALQITRSNIGEQDGSALLIKYDNLDELDTDPPAIEIPEWGDRCVQVTGTFNAGTVVIEGSNDGLNFVTLTDPQGTSISKTAAFIEQVSELTRFIRPRVSAGATVDLDVFFVLRRSSSMRT
jgi:hypothetical protein